MLLLHLKNEPRCRNNGLISFLRYNEELHQSDDILDLISPQFCDSVEGHTSQCESSRPRPASTASCAMPRTTLIFSHMPGETRETRCCNEWAGKEEWRCKHCSKTYCCSGRNSVPAKHLTDPPPEGHGLSKGAPRTAKMSRIGAILEQVRLTALDSPQKRRL